MANKKGLDERHRDRDGTISRKHGNTKVGTLRKEFGEQFAEGGRSDLLLKNLLSESGATSLDDGAKAVRECKSILVEASVPNRFVTQPFEFEFELVSQMQHAALQINDHQVIR